MQMYTFYEMIAETRVIKEGIASKYLMKCNKYNEF